MSYNGSGTFQINTSGQPVVAGTVISSTAFNALTADLATGLSTAITKDGQTTTTARIPFAAGINSSSATDSTSTATGSIITSGGVGIAKALYVGTTANVAGAVTLQSTLGVTGVATFSAAPIYSSLTASSAVATDASKALVSVTNTGTGNNVLATSPTLVTPILGTPQSGTLTNATGLPLSTGVTGTLPEANGGTGTTTGYYGFKNRIINGAMVIDQRNAGASITPTGGQYLVDRYVYEATQSSKVTAQQNAGAVTPPVGFIKYLGVTSSSAYSVLTGDTFLFSQRIEGFNVADLAFGTASAATVTLSFWVRSSLTGTFGGSLCNGALNRSYPFSYTISSANTWEQKTITVAGDTTGTWTTDNTAGLNIRFGLGSGATLSGTAGAWAAGNFVQPTSTVSVVGTNGATFYITGVQLEKGSTATSFDYRPYGSELALCQRNLPAKNSSSAFEQITIGWCSGATGGLAVIPYQVQPRVPPTGITVSSAANFGVVNSTGAGINTTAITFATAGLTGAGVNLTVATGLAAGNATYFYAQSSSAKILFTGCEL